jgi:TolA-binding protein
MQLTGFLCLMLVLTAGWMRVYSASREMFNGISEYKEQIVHLKQVNQDDRLAMALDREQFLEFRQNVATLMPDVLKEKGMGEEGYPYRSLASTISRADAEKVRAAIAKTMFERGKDYFRKKEFVKSQHIFQQMIDHYGYTPYVAESYFLLAESHFQQSELEECTTVIQTMVELFPHHELTGFALIRLGRIYEIQNRNEEAVEIYKTVLRSYPQRDVASQAKASLKGVEL